MNSAIPPLCISVQHSGRATPYLSEKTTWKVGKRGDCYRKKLPIMAHSFTAGPKPLNNGVPMKRLSCSLALVLATTVASSASFASSSTDINVIGAITPASCVPSVTGGGIFELGRIPTSDLNENSTTALPPVQQTLTINCNGPTRFALHGDDARTGTALWPSNTTYGFGTRNVGYQIGRYFIHMAGTQIDGVAADALFSDDSGASWNPYPSRDLPRNQSSMSHASVGGAVPASITDLVSTLIVKATINRTSLLNITDEFDIWGLVSIEITYL